MLQIIIKRAFLTISMLALVLLPYRAWAAEQNTGVTFDVNDTVLKVTGRTFPGAFVTILDGQSVIGNVTANAGGNFEKTFPAQSPGLHDIKVFAKDLASDVTTDTVTQNVSLQAQTETTLNVFLPPTIVLSPTKVTVGDTVRFSGKSIPHSQVTLVVDNNLTLTATTDGSGAWQIEVVTDGFFIGTHSAYAVAQDSGGGQSSPTQKRLFVVESPPAASQPAPSEEPEGPIPTPVIDFPASNQHFSESPVTIRGTGQPNSQIELYDGDTLIGSAFVNSQGEWSITLDLTKERYDLRVRSCFEERCSDFSDTVTIYYDGLLDEGFEVTLSHYRFFGIVPEQEIEIGVNIRGGEPPYKIVIDWGDDRVETFTLNSRATTFRQAYEAIGNYNGIVTVSDDNGIIRTNYFSVNVEAAEVWRWVPPAIAGAGIALLLVAVGRFFVYPRFVRFRTGK